MALKKTVIKSPKGYSLMDITGVDPAFKSLMFHYKKRSKLGNLLRMRKTLIVKKKSKSYKRITNHTPKVGCVTIIWE